MHGKTCFFNTDQRNIASLNDLLINASEEWRIIKDKNKIAVISIYVLIMPQGVYLMWHNQYIYTDHRSLIFTFYLLRQQPNMPADLVSKHTTLGTHPVAI